MSRANAPVLVLGAGSDIARALALEFAKAGHPIQLAARRPEMLERDRADMALRVGSPITAHVFDACAPESFAGFLEGLPATPHIVICAVGYMGDQDANAGNVALTQQVVETNFTGPALILEMAAARLAELRAETTIIGISSVAGDRGRAKNYVYGAAKAGFSAYLSGLRQKYAGARLLVMTVKPGFVRTAMTEGMDLPGPLTAEPETLAQAIYQAHRRRKPVFYELRWRLVMTIIKLLPERVFMKTSF